MENWEHLVEQARGGIPGPLLHALRDLSAKKKAFESRSLVLADLPECVIQFLNDQHSPSGKPGMRARSEWELLIVRTSFQELRDLFKFAKKTNASDGDGAVLSEVKGVTPTERALDVIANNLNLSSDAVRDIVYHERKKTK